MFTYAITWGVNNGILPDATYRPIVTKAWNGLVSIAVQSTGLLGYCQGTGQRPSDGQPIKAFPVSLGKASTPTYLGTKVVMEKKNPQHMVSAPGEANPYSLEVPWSVRLTNSGEFVHAAAWNTGNIGSRSTSHGCTNLTVADAKWFYNFSIIGDVATYVNTGTSNVMPSWDGIGDWNVSWSEWEQGNLLKNN